MESFGSESYFHSWPSAEIAMLFVILIAVVIFTKSAFIRKAVQKTENFFSHFAQRKKLAVCFLFFAVVLVRLAVLPLLHVPVPGIHDEFSYLLMADTFAHGRLANPTHPMWISFESFHVNWHPTYSSKYPPAQGFVLAVGQVLGHPWIGVLLSDAAMCAAILWMLQAWMPARWALLGAVLAALKLGVASYWMNSYWGGAVAAAGGALVLGGLVRMTRHARVRDALLTGLGIAILANSRPFEGLILCVPAGIYFLWWLAGKTRCQVSMAARLRQAAIPLGLVLLITGLWILHYNKRLTGHALLFPYVLNARTYPTTTFVFQKPAQVIHYNNPQFSFFYDGIVRLQYAGTWDDLERISWEKMTRWAPAFLWMGLLLALPGLPFAFRDRKFSLLRVTLMLVLLASFAVVWSNSHYIAPVTCIIFALIVQSLRHLRTIRVGRLRLGIALSWAVVALLVLDTATAVANRSCDPVPWTCHGITRRAAFENALSRTPGKHLVMVRYERNHDINEEWVYNRADIDAAKVVWARELGEKQDAKLFAYFKDRRIWLVDPDLKNSDLLPYSPRRKDAGEETKTRQPPKP